MTRYASEADARRALEDRDAYGAFVLGALGPERLLTACCRPGRDATRRSAARPATRGAGGGAARPRRSARHDLNPVLPLVITSILAGLIASQLVPDLRLPLWLLVLLGAGVVAGLIDLLIVNTAIGALPPCSARRGWSRSRSSGWPSRPPA